MEETSKVKGAPLAVGLAGVPDELDENFIKRKLSLSEVLCGLLIVDPVTKDVQKKGLVNGPED